LFSPSAVSGDLAESKMRSGRAGAQRVRRIPRAIRLPERRLPNALLKRHLAVGHRF
jgi:hypothetical protein